MPIARKGKANVRKLIEQRDRLMAEVLALQNQIAGLEMAITLIGDPSEEPAPKTGKRPNVKDTLHALLKEAGTTGLNAQSAVAMAAQRNIKLEPGTTSSTLSRMKREGAITYDGQRYRLPEFSRPPMTVVQGGSKSS
jgi:hypothetical protein